MLEVSFELSTSRPKQIGLIVLQADETIEVEMKKLMPDAVSLLVSRVPSGTHVTLESLAAMEANLRGAARLLPENGEFSALGYGCTSGTAQIGAARVEDALKSEVDTPHVTEPVSALIAACRHLGVNKIGLLSPYIQSVSEKLCEVLEDQNIQIAEFMSFNESQEDRVARIAPDSIVSAASKLAESADMDAIFISCTNLKTLTAIDRIETETGKPVLTSNQTLAWHLLRLSGIDTSWNFAGKLWRA